MGGVTNSGPDSGGESSSTQTPDPGQGVMISLGWKRPVGKQTGRHRHPI